MYRERRDERRRENWRRSGANWPNNPPSIGHPVICEKWGLFDESKWKKIVGLPQDKINVPKVRVDTSKDLANRKASISLATGVLRLHAWHFSDYFLA